MTKGKVVGYKRVSTPDQRFDRQLTDIRLDKEFLDNCSAKTIERPGLTELRNYVREDDVVYVHSIDRLARNVRDLQNIVHEFNKKHVTLHVVQFNLIFDGRNDALSSFLLNVIGSVAEFERALMRERQMEGIAEAKKRGAFKGRQPCFSDETAKIIHEKIQYGVSKAKIARQLGVSRQTIYNYAK